MALTLHTTLGDIKIELYCEQVPRSAENFLALAASGYYDGTIFHRNIKGFMIQGGDPTGTGKGGRSIFSTANGKFPDELNDALKHSKRGILSMANSGPDTNGSQSIITNTAQLHLNNSKGTVFGHAIAGMNVPDKMEEALAKFFITYKAHPHLNGKYTVFGHVIDGMDVLDKMEKVPVDPKDKPKQEIRLTRITIHANPMAS